MGPRSKDTEDLSVIQPMRLFHHSNLYLSLLFVAVALEPLVAAEARRIRHVAEPPARG